MRPVGATQETEVDVRVIAATNRDVESDVAREVPPGPLLSPQRHSARAPAAPRSARRHRRAGRAVPSPLCEGDGQGRAGLTADALRALESYPFPGNVRELENMIERAVALAESRAIGLGDLPPDVSGMAASTTPSLLSLPPEGCKLDDVLAEVERRLLVDALERTGGLRKGAADLLGISFNPSAIGLRSMGSMPTSTPGMPRTAMKPPTALRLRAPRALGDPPPTYIDSICRTAPSGTRPAYLRAADDSHRHFDALVERVHARRVDDRRGHRERHRGHRTRRPAQPSFRFQNDRSAGDDASIPVADQRWKAENLPVLRRVAQRELVSGRSARRREADQAKFLRRHGSHPDAARWSTLRPVAPGPVQFGYLVNAGPPSVAMRVPEVTTIDLAAAVHRHDRASSLQWRPLVRDSGHRRPGPRRHFRLLPRVPPQSRHLPA